MKALPLLLALSLPLCAQVRTWKNTAGKSIKAELITADDTHVTLKRPYSNKKYKIALDTLSEGDQEFVKKWLTIKSEEIEAAKAAAAKKEADRIVFNGQKLIAGQINELKGMPLPEKWQKAFGHKTYDAKIILPPNFDPNKKYPIIQHFVAGTGNPLGSLNSHKHVTSSNNCVAFAVYTSAGNTVHPIYDMCNLLEEKWGVKTKKWPLIHTGFSGGGKKTGMLAADMVEQGMHLVGCFASGVNENRFEHTLERVASKTATKKRYKKMAVWLNSATSDTIADPEDHKRVERQMKESGIKITKIFTFEGGHVPGWGSLPEGIKWILDNSDANLGE